MEGEGEVEAGKNEMLSVPEKRATLTLSAIGSTATRGRG